MLNFKQFLKNASDFLNAPAETKPLTSFPLEFEPKPMKEAVKVFQVKRCGKSYMICAENNVTWHCPTAHYHLLSQMGKAPEVGDMIRLTFYPDGTVKSFVKS